MSRFLKCFVWSVCVILLSVVIMTSCGSGEAETRYVAAKLVDSDLWSIVDVKTGEVIHKDEFKSQPSVIVNGKFCVKNESGLYDYFSVDNVTKPINSEGFLYATSFSENEIALAVLKGKGISLINGKCEIIKTLDNSIVTAYEFSNGYSVISNDAQKYGYINEAGEVVIKPVYDSAGYFSEDGYAMVAKEINDSTYKYIAIDSKGKELFSFSSNEYKNVGTFIDGYIPVKQENDDVVLLDKTGKKVCSIGKWNDYIPSWLGFHDDVIVFMDGDSYGLKNKEGSVVIRAKYEELVPLPKINSGYYLAKKQGKYGVVDKDDKVIIPFDYNVLGYLNKDVLYVGEGKSFSFMNRDLKDIGQNNYTNLSFMTNSYVRSNYFNADKEAAKIIENINDSTFFKTKSGMHLSDFKDKLSGYKYADMDESTLHEYGHLFSFIYAFDRTLASQRYEYIYGYSFPTTPEYNYNANLAVVVAVNSNYKDYQSGSEEALAKAFDSLIQKQGYKPVEGRPNWFKNERTGRSVALAYDEGEVSVMYAYIDEYKDRLDAKRNPRKNESDGDVRVDFVDAFGLDNGTESDSVAVVEEEFDTIQTSPAY